MLNDIRLDLVLWAIKLNYHVIIILIFWSHILHSDLIDLFGFRLFWEGINLKHIWTIMILILYLNLIYYEPAIDKIMMRIRMIHVFLSLMSILAILVHIFFIFYYINFTKMILNFGLFFQFVVFVPRVHLTIFQFMTVIVFFSIFDHLLSYLFMYIVCFLSIHIYSHRYLCLYLELMESCLFLLESIIFYPSFA